MFTACRQREMAVWRGIVAQMLCGRSRHTSLRSATTLIHTQRAVPGHARPGVVWGGVGWRRVVGGVGWRGVAYGLAEQPFCVRG